MQSEMIPATRSWRSRMLRWFRLTDETVIKLYHGYGHTSHLLIQGHVLSLSPLPRKRYRHGILFNTLALLRLFMVRPVAWARLRAFWDHQLLEAHTDEHGFFRFEWETTPGLPQGWHELPVQLVDAQGRVLREAIGRIYIPHPTQHGFISDVDDTFLISHSSNLRKRLTLLLTRNARSRRSFDGSVRHYRLLMQGNTTPDAPNPFFYVSSSEWNLYDYLQEFHRVQGLPEGVFLLNILKRFGGLLKTGQSNHHTKFTRIVRIIEGFPNQKFVLLGDNTQQDPVIYEAVVRHFPHHIRAVYIRDINAQNRDKTLELLRQIEAQGVPCCFFKHSAEAIAHSREIGLITSPDEAA